jgi:GTP-binding protein
MLPKVSIIGRPNVGKSSLTNLLSGKLISIVDPTAGVTRDRVTVDLELPPLKNGGPPRFAELMDTGGYGVYSGDDQWGDLTEDVERQISYAVDEATLILFVIDAQTGLTPLDRQVADLLRKQVKDHKKIMLIANKVDHQKHLANAMEAMELGFGEPLAISATSGDGKWDLLEAISLRLGEEADHPPVPTEMKLAIVGKRNAGKSTLVNQLAGEERVIASEIPGTTRDSVDVKFEMDGRTFTAIDTAGVRKRKSMSDDIEFYSLHRALRSIRRADVVLLMIDATEDVSQIDKHLMMEINEHFKPSVIVINKWDLAMAQGKQPEDYLKYLNEQLTGITFSPIAFITATNGEGVKDAVRTAMELFEQAGTRVPTAELNEVFQKMLQERGPTSKLGLVAKIYYATMTTVHPPTIALFVNRLEVFPEQYKRYLINGLRRHTVYTSVPIKLMIRPKKREHDDE